MLEALTLFFAVTTIVAFLIVVVQRVDYKSAARERERELARLRAEYDVLKVNAAHTHGLVVEAGAACARAEAQRDTMRDELLRRVNPLDYPLAHALYLQSVPNGRVPWTTWIAREGAAVVDRLLKRELYEEVRGDVEERLEQNGAAGS